MAGALEVLRRQIREVAKLEGDHAREFLRLLRETKEALAGRLLSLNGQDLSLDGFRVQQVMAETDAAITAMTIKATGLYQGKQAQAAQMSVEHLANELDAVSSTLEVAPVDIAIDAQAVLADPVQGLLANHYESSVDRYGLDVLNGVRRDLFVGLRSGATLGDIASGLVKSTGSFGDKAKMAADRLARTEISTAFGAAKSKAFEKASEKVPGLRRMWVKVGSFPCKICDPLQGTMRADGETWTIRQGKKTREIAHPPAHPNCACTITAIKPSWREGLEKLGYLDAQPGAEE